MIFRKVLTTLCFMSFFAGASVPVAPIERTYTQPNGYTFKAIGKGNIHHHWMQTLDGKAIKKVGRTWYYVNVDENNQSFVSAHIVGSLSPAALQNVPDAKFLPKPQIIPKPAVIKSQSNVKANLKRVSNKPLANAQAVTSQNVVVVLVSFADQTFKYDSASFRDLVFSDTFTNGFFKSSSYNNYQLAQAAESFGTANDGMIEVTLGINHPNNKDVPQSVIHAAYAAADPFINYAAFDTNGDTTLSAKELSIVFIAAGFENSFCGSDCAFGKVVWGHAFSTDSVSHDGVDLSPYSMFGERHGIAVDDEHQATMGIIAHELGHLMLDLPDLYDSDQSSEGIGSWGLMGGGSWGQLPGEFSGTKPSGMLAWSKAFSGFVTPTEINASGALNLASSTTTDAYAKVWIDKYKLWEYFLLENRNVTGVDAALVGKGLLVTHIDDSQTDNTNDTRRWVDIEAADGTMADGDAGDTFPGTSSKTEFTDSTTPNTKGYDGTSNGISVTGISESGNSIAITNVTPRTGLGGNIRYNDNKTTGASFGYTTTSMWTALNVTNTTTFDMVDGFEVYLKETATVTAFLYDTITNGVLGTQGYTQSAFNGVAGWNRFLFTTPQQLNVNSSVVLVLNIVSSTSTHAISYNYTDTAPSGRSYANSRQGGTFEEISADNGDLNQHVLMSAGDSGEMTTTAALAQITNENFKTCLSALFTAQNLTLASEVTTVDCSGKSVNTITGIENFPNLSSLNLSTNQIIDVSKLTTLTKLTSLQLDNNLIVDVSSLTTLVNLVTLLLNNNQIVDISTLSTLTALTTLNLSSNQIAVITALSSLSALQSLEIESNQLTDLTPLMPTFVLTMTTVKLLGNDTLPCWQMDYIQTYSSIVNWVRSAACDSTADAMDSDGDGLTNRAELTAGTNPTKADTDGDGQNDNVDILPLDNQRWTNTDTDGDTFTDDVETLLGLDINDAADVWIDADGDRLPLVLELQHSKDKDVKDNDVFNNVTLLVNQAFVDMQYKFATADELTFWIDRLTTKAGTPVDLYSTALTETDFAFMGFIGRTYLAVMLREPDLGGIRFHFGKLKGGGSKQDVVDSFVSSGEFETRYGSLTNAEFVNLVYTNVLGRSADTDGLAFWVGELDAARHTRGSMMLQFIESAEFISTNDEALRIDVLSQILTGTRPADHYRVTYKAWLVAEGNPSSILKALLASDGNRNNLMATITAGTADTDSDGIPDGVEFTDNLDPATKSNDINNDDALFVKQVMRDMLGEPWEFASVTAQNTALTAAGSRSAWVKGLLDNDDFKNKRQSISRLYFAFFLRRSDHAGLMFWIGRRETDLGMTDIADSFVTSTEFQTTYGSLSNGDFVSLVYQNVLSRAPDDAGLAFWTGQLDSSAISRGGLMVGFSESAENLTSAQNRGRAILLYHLLYRRDITDQEYTDALSALEGGTDAGVLIDAILNASEFHNRFY